MLYFTTRPNYHQLSNYYQFHHSVEDMVNYHPEGFDIVIDYIETDEEVERITNGFKAIVAAYGLEAHYDNLFFLTLGKINQIESVLYELQFQHAQKKRTKELASILLAFSEAPTTYNSILLKTLRTTGKITDGATINWIGKTLTNAIKKGNMPLSDYEPRIMKDFFDDDSKETQLSKEKLEAEALKAIPSPTKKIKSYLADFCLYQYLYLINETSIIPNRNVLLSDAILNYFFDVLKLFGYLNDKMIDSPRKDYMNALLHNRLKTLNIDNQGDKKK